MKRILLASAVALLTALSFAPTASARGRFFIGGGYGFYGPPAYGWYGPAWYGPRIYGPYGARYYGPYSRENTGKVKIVTHVKGDLIFVDGGYAGVTGKLKKFQLRPGQHTIELRDPSGRSYYQERVTVIRGRTVEIEPMARSQGRG